MMIRKCYRRPLKTTPIRGIFHRPHQYQTLTSFLNISSRFRHLDGLQWQWKTPYMGHHCFYRRILL